MKRKLWRVALVVAVVFAALGGGGTALASHDDQSPIFYPAPTPGWGITWQKMNGSPLNWTPGCNQCPYSVDLWAGYRLYTSVNGASGRHIYASTTANRWTDYAISLMKIDATDAIPSAPSQEIDFQRMQGGFGELHATGWFYTNLPSAEGWSENDDEHPFHEEFIVWWDPYGMVAGEPYDIDVEFWDPHVGSKGSINFAQSQNVVFLRDSQPFSTWWKDKFCTGPYDQGKPEEYNARPMFVYPCDWK